MRRCSLVRGVVVLVALSVVGAVWAQPAGGPPPRVGLLLQALSPDELDSIQRAIGYRVGVRVTEVMPGTPAARAAAKPGDIILAINKKGVAIPEEAVAALNAATGRVELTCARASGPGELTSLTLWVDLGGAPPVTTGAPPVVYPPVTTGAPPTVYPPATTGAPPTVYPPATTTTTTTGPEFEPLGVGGVPAHMLGLNMDAFDPDEMAEVQKLTGLSAGVRVMEVTPGSPAAAAGIREDDVLYQIGTTTLTNPAMVEGALGAGGRLDCKLWRGDEQGKIITAPVTLNAEGLGGGFIPGPVMTEPVPGPVTTTVVSQVGSTDVVRVQAQLQALDAARGAGILTEEEYARKRGELEGQLRAAMPPVMDEATKQKLAALDAARAAGILTEEEYARKRGELTGAAGGQTMLGQVTPGWTPGTVMGPAPGPETVVTTTTDGKTTEFGDPKGRFVVSLPEGWRGETPADGPAGRVTGPLGSMDIRVEEKGPAAQDFLDNVEQQIKAQFQGFQEMRRGKIDFSEGQGPFAECAGVNPNGQRTTVFLAANADDDENAFLLIFEVPQAQTEPGRAIWQTLVKGFQMGTVPFVPFTWF